VLNAVRIRLQGAQAERAVAVERVDDALSEVIVVDPVSGADGTLARLAEQMTEPAAVSMWRVGDGEAGGDVFVVPVPVRPLAIGVARKHELNVRDLIGLSGFHCVRAVRKDLAHPDIRTGLISVR